MKKSVLFPLFLRNGQLFLRYKHTFLRKLIVIAILLVSISESRAGNSTIIGDASTFDTDRQKISLSQGSGAARKPHTVLPDIEEQNIAATVSLSMKKRHRAPIAPKAPESQQFLARGKVTDP